MRSPVTHVAAAVGIVLPPTYVALGLFLPATEILRMLTLLVVVASGVLIGRWWAFAPTVLTFAALQLAEEANYRGVGPGSRTGTVVELHTSEFSLGYFLFTMALSIALPTVGLGLRWIALRSAGQARR